MSKHLLYCKDLLNRTLTRSLLFVLAQLVACLIVLIQVLSPAEAAGPLSVKTANPRYFFDSKENPVYLTGSYLNEYNLLSGSWDFASYLDFLQQQKQNFTRVWGWEQSPWSYDANGQVTFSTQPYERTGPGLALDGAPRFDLTRFNQAYFDQLRSRVVQAAQRGIYVSVMLFEGFSTQKKLGRVNPWLGDPFQQTNNINGINGDRNRNGSNDEFFSLAYPSLLALQEAFVRKVVDTLNDLDNVLYEINGNGLAGSLSWQYQMIDYVKRYQKKQANQHPVGISDFYAGVTAEVLNSSAEWIVIPETNLNPPPASTKKVLIMEGTPPVSGGQVLSTSPISLVQLLPDSVASSQSSGISNNAPSSNGVTLSSSSATSSTLSSTQSSSNQQSQVATPTITPNGGLYSGTVAVTLQTTTSGASIYYTTDGQSPTQSSPHYNGKFKVSGSTLVKAKAFKNNFDPSAEASAWFANAGSPSVSPSGLMAYWKFDEGSGTTVADASGNGNKGTLVNGPLWTTGRVGNALYFDGINDNITVPDSNSLDLSNSFTLSAWVNPASTFTDFRSILVKNYSYYLYASVAGYCGDGSPLGGFSQATAATVCQPSPLPTNTWTHLAVTYNGSTLTFYRDGVAVTTSTVSGSLSPTTGILQIAGSQFGEYFKGLIDEVRIYNKALSDTEIQTVYQQDSATLVQNVATPAISPSGGDYTSSVPVTMQTATSGASIHYTTDGSTPTQSSTMYAGTVTLTSSATMKAKAFKSGSNASAEASASFTVTQPFSFSLSNSGDKSVVAGSSVTNSINAALTSGSAQAVTLSASGLPTGATTSFSSATCSPTCSSTLTINASASTPAGSSTITVTAAGGGVTKTTTFGLNVSLPTVATPTISPSGGSYAGSVSITMQTATSGASIYYTTDGSTPTQSSTLYTGTKNLTSSATVKAQAFKSGYNPSAQASASFTFSQPFSFSLSNSGDQSVTAGSSVTNSVTAALVSGSSQAASFSVSGLPTGATASFSSTSCSPNCSSTLTINTSSSTPAGSSTITVAASGGGMTKTTAFSLNVSLQTVATPAISPNGGNFINSVSVTMQTVTSGASIYYTTNGSSPTQSSTLYTGAITLASSTVVKAKAVKNGSNPSAEATASFIVTPAGLVAHWKFDEGSGTSATDASGNGNTGTLVNGPVWSAGRVGKALLFDGINEHVAVADSNSLDLSSAFTLSAWVNPASAFTDFRSILVKNYSYYLYASVASYCGNGSPVGGFSGATAQTVCQPSPLPTNTWTHLAVTYDGSTLTFYRDGVAVATSTVSGTLSPTTGTLQIGGSQFGEYFNGLIDEVRIYNKALNDTEIQTAYLQDSPSQTVTPVIPGVNQPFSFSLANSGNKSVVAGSSVTNSIAVTLVSGSSQTVSFGVSGLPSGATGSFSSTSCTPACSTVLNISTNGSTPAGNFPITITSTGGGVTKTTAFTLSVTVATPTNTSGATYWVAKTGSDSNSCAQAQSQGGAKLTINGGIACMSSGDTLYIMSGSYNEFISSHLSYVGTDESCRFLGGLPCVPNGTAGAYTTVSAAPGHERKVFINGFGSPPLYFSGPVRFLAIKGMVFSPNRDQVEWVSTGFAGGSGCAYEGTTGEFHCVKQGNESATAQPTQLLIENNEFRDAHRSCILGFGVSSGYSPEPVRDVPSANIIIRGNDIHDCGSDRFDHGIYTGGRNLIENNRIWNISGFAIQLQDTGSNYVTRGTIVRNNLVWDSGGIYVSEYDKQAYNNVIYRSGSTFCSPWLASLGLPCQLGLLEASGVMVAYGAGHIIANNTVYNSAIGILIGFNDSNNQFYNNTCVACSLRGVGLGSVSGIFELAQTDGSGDVFSDNPVVTSASALVNPGSQNFQLAPGANPLVNTGTSTPSAFFTVDANGVTRGQEGGQWDIGACERFSGASSCPNFQGTTPLAN